MYQANLSYRVLQRYLNEVIDASLITIQINDQRYRLTVKGAQYLEAYKDYDRCSKNMEKHLYDFSVKRESLENLCPVKHRLSENARQTINI
jgi:hypothetical protein